jgi:HK97 family phage portal protein
MAILDSIRGIFSRWGGSGHGWPSVVYPGSRIDYDALAGDPWLNSVVALGVKWLGDRYPRPLMQVSRIGSDGKWTPLARHDAVDLWRRPNEYYSGRALAKAVGLSLVVDGNAYILKARDGAGRVKELWWLPHYKVCPTWEGEEFISGYSIETDGGVRPLAYEDVIHVRDGLDPENPRKGLSTMAAMRRELCSVNEDSAYTASLLRNCGVPGLMVIPNDPQLRPTPDDGRRIRERIREAVTGDNRGETVVLLGNYRVEQVGFSPEQLRLDSMTQPAQARLASAIGVALMSLGLPDPGKTYSNLAEANRMSWGAVSATQELIAEALRYGLLPEFRTDPETFTVEFDYSQIAELQESQDALWARVAAGFQAGLIQLNEGRDLIGQKPVPEGDRWFPGTGDPAEIARNVQEDLLYSGAISGANAANDKPANGKPAAGANGDGNGRMNGGKAWRY